MKNKQVLNEDILAMLFALLDMALFLPIPRKSKKLYKAAADDYKSLHRNFRSIFPDLDTNKQRQLHKKVMKDIDDLGVQFKVLLKQVTTDYDEARKKDKNIKSKSFIFGRGRRNEGQISIGQLEESIRLLDNTKTILKEGKSIAQNAAIAISKKEKAEKEGKPVTYKTGKYEHNTANPNKDHKRLMRKHQASGNKRLAKVYRGKIKEDKLNEISVKAGFDDIQKGRTSSIDGVKMSKDMVAAIMDWMAMSAYGRKYSKQIMKSGIHSLLRPADAFGIERFLTPRLKREWKAIMKKHKPKREGINEQRPMFQDTPNEFAYLDFKKWAYRKRGMIKKALLKALGNREDGTKMFVALRDIWVTWAKANAKEWSYTHSTNVAKKDFGRALAVMMKKDGLILSKSGNKLTTLESKSSLDDIIMQEYNNLVIEHEVKFTKDEMAKLHKDGKVIKKDDEGKDHTYLYSEGSIIEQSIGDKLRHGLEMMKDELSIDEMIKLELQEQGILYKSNPGYKKGPMSKSQTAFLSGKLKLKRGDKITYDRHFMFGKVDKDAVDKVVAVHEYKVILVDGPELDLRQDPIKKINGKTIK